MDHPLSFNRFGIPRLSFFFTLSHLLLLFFPCLFPFRNIILFEKLRVTQQGRGGGCDHRKALVHGNQTRTWRPHPRQYPVHGQIAIYIYMDTFYIRSFFFLSLPPISLFLSISLLFHYCYYWKRGVCENRVLHGRIESAPCPPPHPPICICQTEQNLYNAEIIVTTEIDKNNMM